MQRPALFLAAAAFITLTACRESKVEETTPDREAKVSINLDGDNKTPGNVTIDADSDTGKLELKLPGGIEAKVNLPEGMGEHGKFDIDGVGLFPGAKVRSVNINAADRREAKTAVVKIGFTAPGDAAAVADWYQQQFDAKGTKVARSGELLSGTTEDGDAFTLAIEATGAGASKGLLTITDTKDS